MDAVLTDSFDRAVALRLAFGLGVAVSICAQIIQGRAAQVGAETHFHLWSQVEGAERAKYLAQVESMLAPLEIMPLDFLVNPF